MKKLIFRISTSLSTLLLYLYIYPVSEAQAQTFGCNGGNYGIIADWICKNIKPTPGMEDANKQAAGNLLNNVISAVIGILTVLAGLWFMIQFILAAISWISAGGDKHNLETARNKIFHAIIGLVIVVAAWVIIGLLGRVFGLDILNPGSALLNIWR